MLGLLGNSPHHRAFLQTHIWQRQDDGSWAKVPIQSLTEGDQVRVGDRYGVWVGLAPTGTAWVCWGKWAPERAAHLRTQLERLRAVRGHARRSR